MTGQAYLTIAVVVRVLGYNCIDDNIFLPNLNPFFLTCVCVSKGGGGWSLAAVFFFLREKHNSFRENFRISFVKILTLTWKYLKNCPWNVQISLKSHTWKYTECTWIETQIFTTNIWLKSWLLFAKFRKSSFYGYPLQLVGHSWPVFYAWQ